MWIADLWNLTSWKYEKNTLSMVSQVDLTHVLILNFCNTVKPCLTIPSVGIKAQITKNQKKQHNQTIKPPGELCCLIPLFFFVLTIPGERPRCRDTRSIHTPHYCGQFHTVAAACKVSSHQSQRKITQHSLSSHFHCFMVRAANPYRLLGLAELLHDLTVCFIPRERKPFHFLQIQPAVNTETSLIRTRFMPPAPQCLYYM